MECLGQVKINFFFLPKSKSYSHHDIQYFQSVLNVCEEKHLQHIDQLMERVKIGERLLISYQLEGSKMFCSISL